MGVVNGGATAMILNDLINSETTFQSPLGPAGVGILVCTLPCAKWHFTLRKDLDPFLFMAPLFFSPTGDFLCSLQ